MLSNRSYCFIILATGSSFENDRDIPPFTFKGKTLLRHTVDEAMKAAGDIIVVTNSEKEYVQLQLAGLPIHLVETRQKESGMRGSILTGVSYALENFMNLQGVILSVCDQPFIMSKIFIDLMDKQEQTNKNMIVCKYREGAGVPVLFGKKYLGEINETELKIPTEPDEVAEVSFPLGDIHIKTPEDYVHLLTM